MALVIEDGTGLTGAQAYADAATVRSYATLRGFTLSADDSVLEPLIVLATDYLQALEYILEPFSNTQALAWPRCIRGCVYYGLILDFFGNDLTQPQYPQKTLQAATAQLVIDQAINGVVLQPTTVGGKQFIVEEKVDVITTRYSEKLGTLSTPTLRAVMAILRDITVTIGMLRSVRV